MWESISQVGPPTPFFEELLRGCWVTVTCRDRDGPGGQSSSSSGKAKCRQATCRAEMGIHTAAAGLGIASPSQPSQLGWVSMPIPLPA